MEKQTKKRVDMYDIGEGLVLMNIITKNENGKMHQITTYIGTEGNGFICVGDANDLDEPGAIFSYQSYVRMQKTNLPIMKMIYKNNLNERC